jgi:hypothetical protein
LSRYAHYFYQENVMRVLFHWFVSNPDIEPVPSAESNAKEKGEISRKYAFAGPVLKELY